VFPSKKAIQRERGKLHEMTNSHQCFNPTFALRAKIWAETPLLSLQALQYQ
jgi:hypothetical protein